MAPKIVVSLMALSFAYLASATDVYFFGNDGCSGSAYTYIGDQNESEEQLYSCQQVSNFGQPASMLWVPNNHDGSSSILLDISDDSCSSSDPVVYYGNQANGPTGGLCITNYGFKSFNLNG